MRRVWLVGLALWLGGCATPPPLPTPAPTTAAVAPTVPTVVPTAAAPAPTVQIPPTQLPATAQPTALAASGVQTSPPPPLPVRGFSLPQMTETTLENGLRVIVVPKPSLPYLTMQLVLPGGQSAGPSNLAGLSAVTADLLTRGTTTRSAQDIARAIEGVGGSLSASANLDQLSISAGVLSEHTDLAFELLGDVALHPTFPREELETRRQRMLTSLRSSLASPGTVANRAFDAVLYGPHPYGRVATEQSLGAITRDDVAVYYDAQRKPAGAHLVVVGDITVEDALERARTTFGGWTTADATTALTYPPPPARSERLIYLVDRPGSSQAEVRIGHPALPGASRERHAAQVANQVLGGGSTSRLFTNLREQKGWTYGVYSGFSFPRDVGDLTVAAAVRNEVVEPAIREIVAEMERLRSRPVPPEELAGAKSYLIGSYAVGLQTPEALAGQIASLALRGLPLVDLWAYPQTIERIDGPLVTQTTQQYIRPDQAAIVVVGDAASIRDSLARIAPVTRIDADGQPLP